jgi:hypothetical protein
VSNRFYCTLSFSIGCAKNRNTVGTLLSQTQYTFHTPRQLNTSVAKRKFTLLLYIAPALDTNDARNRSATGLTFISLVGTVAPGMLEDL